MRPIYRRALLAISVVAVCTVPSAVVLAGDYDANCGCYESDGYGSYDRHYDEERYRPYDRVEYRNGYRHDDYYGSDGYDGDDRYRRHDVCDPDGDRCYRSSSDYWNYREYYRVHGYRWQY